MTPEKAINLSKEEDDHSRIYVKPLTGATLEEAINLSRRSLGLVTIIAMARLMKSNHSTKSLECALPHLISGLRGA